MKNSLSSFSSKKLSSLLQKNFQVVLVGAIVVVLLIGTFIATQLSQQEQNIQQQAASDQGIIEVQTLPATTPLTSGTNNTINFSMNTHDLQILGATLRFTLLGNLNSAPTFQQVDNSGVTFIINPVISTVSGGYNVTIPLQGAGGPLSSFSSNQFKDIARMQINPNGAQDIQLIYDNNDSNALSSETFEDQLKTLPSLTLQVAGANPTATMCAMPTSPLCNGNQHLECNNNPSGSAVCQTCTCVNNTATSTPTITPSATPTRTPTPIVYLSGSPTPTRTPTPTNTPIPGTGGITVKYCGQSCSSHAECAINLMCYSGVCRLANNPTDTYCNAPADNGIHRTCNEYCADSRECATGYTCYYNRCRNPKNVTDQYCAATTSYTSQSTSTTKTTKATSTPKPTVSSSAAATSTPYPIVTNNGAEATPAWNQPQNTPFPTYAPVVTPEPEDDAFSMVDRIQNWLRALLIVALAVAGIFFLLWLLPILLRRRHDDDDQMPPTSTTGTGESDNTQS